MFKKFLTSVAVVAALGAVSLTESKAATIFGFYSLNGGAITPLSDANGTATGFLYSSAIFGNIGNFSIDVSSATVQPAVLGGGLLQSSAQTTHLTPGPDTLDIFLVGVGFTPGGPQTFTSNFTSNSIVLSNGIGLSVTESTHLGSPLGLNSLLSSASFPPFVLGTSSVAVASPSDGYSLYAQYHIEATGGVTSNGSVSVSAVPGPIVGAGLPGLIAACGGLLALARRRRKQAI